MKTIYIKLQLVPNAATQLPTGLQEAQQTFSHPAVLVGNESASGFNSMCITLKLFHGLDLHTFRTPSFHMLPLTHLDPCHGTEIYKDLELAQHFWVVAP